MTEAEIFDKIATLIADNFQLTLRNQGMEES